MKKLFLFILLCCTGVFVYSAVVQNQFVTNQVANIASQSSGVLGPIFFRGRVGTTNIQADDPNAPGLVVQGPNSTLKPVLILTNGVDTVAIRFRGATGSSESDIVHTSNLGFTFYGPFGAPSPVLGIMTNGTGFFPTNVLSPEFDANGAGGGKLVLTEPVSGQTVTEYASGTNFFVQTISTNSGGALNTNTFNMGNNVNGNLFRFQGTNNTDLIKMDQTGNLTMSNLTGIITVTNFSTGGSWKSPTNAPTANQVLTASSTGGDTKWAAASGSGATWLWYYSSISLYGGANAVNTVRYNALGPGTAANTLDSGSFGSELMYFPHGGIISNLNITFQQGTFAIPTTTNTFLGVYTNSSTVQPPVSVVLSSLFLTMLGGVNYPTNSGTAIVSIPDSTWVCLGWTNNIGTPGGLNKPFSIAWQFLPN